ncbi:MAG: hypothetical protein QHJ73_08280 [Armatimonadota bacterium]|nr:hypothetical protein [Armatimonadota bacterium]
MSASFFWALASTAGTSVNDLLFKRYIAGSGRVGVYFAGAGVVWSAVLLGMNGCRVLSPDRVTLLYGLVAGCFSVTANIALVRALARLDASIGVTIFRLNFVLVMWLAVPLLGEALSLPKLAGLAAAVLAVGLFAGNGRRERASVPVGGLALAVLSSVLRAGMGLTYKLAANHHADQAGFLLLNALCWVVGGVVWGAVVERNLRVDARAARYALASGLLIVEIVVALARALALGQASVILPITQLSFLITALLSAGMGYERFTSRKGVALACGVAAVAALLRA